MTLDPFKAIETILSSKPKPKSESIPLMSSLGRTIARLIVAHGDIPPYDKSAMDGFAVRAADCIQPPTALKIIDLIRAGDSPRKIIVAGTCAKIMTGGMMPHGADTVIRKEDTSEWSADSVLAVGESVVINIEPKTGKDIIFRAEEIERGDTVFTPGTLINPGTVASLANLGVAKLSVFRKPRLTVLATGSELVDLGYRLTKGKIRNSNSYGLAEQASAYGAETTLRPSIGDELPVIARSVVKELSRCDILVTSGGVSVGDFDFVKNVVRDIGMTVHFDTVSMKPGKSVVFASKGGKFLFGLPGNPTSAMMAMELFVRPLVRKISGRALIDDPFIAMTVNETIKVKPSDRTTFVRVGIAVEQGKYICELSGDQGSNNVRTLALSNGYICLPPGTKSCESGSEVLGRFFVI